MTSTADFCALGVLRVGAFIECLAVRNATTAFDVLPAVPALSAEQSFRAAVPRGAPHQRWSTGQPSMLR
ncbi:hypothetical protein C0V72_12910 [Porphyrobacter sp. TH134]|nr:hypothetical protein C0V72_12910 [Porphyrobacter sp. TH134]